MYFQIYDIIFDFFYGSASATDVTPFMGFVAEFLSYICCSAVILIPIAFVYFMFKWLTRLLQWDF